MSELEQPTQVQKRFLHAPIVKSNGKYVAILSDDSLDRQDEVVGKSFLECALDGEQRIVGLLNHKNDVTGLVCEWVQKRIIKINGHNALVAEPKWFLSNPNAAMLKGMLDEGAKIGVSIGAIPKDFDEIEINGMKYRRWTKGEIIEASFVAIPANKHAQIEAVAKSLKMDKAEGDEEQKPEMMNCRLCSMPTEKADNYCRKCGAPFYRNAEGNTMDKKNEAAPAATEVQKSFSSEDIDAVVKAKVEEVMKDFDAKVAAAVEKTLGAMPVYKQLTDAHELAKTQPTATDEVEKAMKDNKIPIMRK